MRRLRWLVVAALCVASGSVLAATSGSITIHADRPGPRISPTLYGIFFEEINCAGDGGLYAELVRNRSFEDGGRPDHWSLVAGSGSKGEIAVDNAAPLSPANPHSLRLTVEDVSGGPVGVANEGYWGIAVRKGAKYNLSLYARAANGFEGPLTVALQGADGSTYATATIRGFGPEWRQYKAALTASATDPKARLAITANAPGTIWLDVVSLFPQDTFKRRPNGLRPDLAAKLMDLKPSFVRFPGGCWVEGDTLEYAMRWKRTIGDLGDRRNQWNLWQYYSTNGLGFHEYLQMCEDLGAEPLFVINCGMSHHGNVPLDQMDEWVQDALDAIEYANGPVTSKWGALRAKAGHPKPFGLKYMEIGNENGGPAYNERYRLFYDAIRAKYPDIHLIADVVPGSHPVEIVDEHYYSSPEFFMQNAHRYDTYRRDGHRVYVGEYAVTQGCGQGNLRAALGEAAFMTGIERNSDVVIMASYAPLFANVNYKRWNPDLINFDSSRVYGTPSYYVQRMFSQNRGDVVLPVDVSVPRASQPRPVYRGAIGVGTWLTQAEYKDIKVTRGGETLFASDFGAGTGGWRFAGGQWRVVDGAMRQTGEGTDCRAVAGDPSWTDYTLSLKARKLGGAEGFLVMFRVQGRDDWIWWNIGGWGNSRTALERCSHGNKYGIGGDAPGGIETGRWYDIRVEVEGPRIRCYLDGKLLTEATDAQRGVDQIYATASCVRSTGEIIVKVVNVSDQEQTLAINVEGVNGLAGRGTALVLTGNPEDENTLDEPQRVAPVQRRFAVSGRLFTYPFAPWSVTVLRVRPGGPSDSRLLLGRAEGTPVSATNNPSGLH